MHVPRSFRFWGRIAPLLLCVALVAVLTSSGQEESGSAALQTASRDAGALQPAAPILLGRGGADSNPAPAEPVFGDEDGETVNPDVAGDPDEALASEEADDAHMRDGLPLTASHPLVAPVIAIQERFTGDLMKHPLVVGTATGMNERGEIAVLVLAKAPITDLPNTLGGVPLMIEVTGELFASKKGGSGGKGKDAPKIDPTARFDRPVPIGVSTGHPDITAGTIGCRVTKGGSVYALSNNHVYASENDASIGDSVIQPGRVDGGVDSEHYHIGTLADFAMLDFSGGNNTIDAAIALCGTDTLGNATPDGGYGVPKSTTVEAALNQRVCKYGRTTGQTKGRISGINARVNVGYGSGVARFVHQILIGGGSFSAGGDSGSLIVVQKGSDANKPVGLLFAGSSSITIANPIAAVLTRFDVTIDGE